MDFTKWTAMQEALDQAIEQGRHKLVGPVNAGDCERWGITDQEDQKHNLIGPVVMLAAGYPQGWKWNSDRSEAIDIRFASEDLKAIDDFMRKMPSHTCLCEVQLALTEERAKLVFTSRAHFEADRIFRSLKIGRYQEEE